MFPHRIVFIAVILGSMQGSIVGLIICKYIEIAGLLKAFILVASMITGIIVGFLEVGLFYRSNQKK